MCSPPRTSDEDHARSIGHAVAILAARQAGITPNVHNILGENGDALGLFGGLLRVVEEALLDHPDPTSLLSRLGLKAAIVVAGKPTDG